MIVFFPESRITRSNTNKESAYRRKFYFFYIANLIDTPSVKSKLKEMRYDLLHISISPFSWINRISERKQAKRICARTLNMNFR